MIAYWVDQQGTFGIQSYCATRGAPIAARFQSCPYEGFATSFVAPRGPQIYSAIDQLTPAQREALRLVWDQMARTAPDLPLLNHPDQVLLRYPLLSRMHAMGINAFRVHRATDLDAVDQFPVFVREEYRHTGAVTRLLASRREVERALWRLRVRGRRIADLLVVEFCDTRDTDGVYRKFAAFRVGDAVVPAHVMQAKHWMVKSRGSDLTLQSAQEDLDFVRENPHAEWIREVTDIGGIGFGRVDYGVLDGRPQVWEINTNPTMSYVPGKQRRLADPDIQAVRTASRELAHAKLREAFCALDPPRPGEPIPLHLPGELLVRIA